jgi:hypothetical protein
MQTMILVMMELNGESEEDKKQKEDSNDGFEV